jgi:hypothetical protein
MKRSRTRSCRFVAALLAGALAAVLAAAPGGAELRAVGIQPLPAALPAAGGATERSGLHLPKNRQISFNYVMTDGGGFRWDIQYYGTVGQGTNYAYSGGMYCQVSGSNVRTNTGHGCLNREGDELEIGPYSRNNLRIYRRVKVYKDAPLARWLDIFENPTGQAVTVPVRIYSYINYGIARTITQGGGQGLGEKDWFFVTESRRRGNNTPSLLHIFAGRRAKVRPTMQIQGNSVYVNWNLTVPANKTVVLCHFESQQHDLDALRKLGRAFRAYKYLKDLPMSVRKLILNMPVGYGFADIDLERSESADLVVLSRGDPMLGTIRNESFEIKTFYGRITLPAEKVLGMVPVPGEPERVRVLMVDGQVISGLPAETTLEVTPTSVEGTLKIPLKRISQWSFRISKARPADVSFAGPMAMLRTGDRVRFDAGATKLSFRTRHGTVPLSGADLLEVSMDNAGNAVHRATFLNGSRLAGFLEPEEVALVLKIGPKLTVPRERIAKLLYASEEQPDPTLTRIVLSNDDELYGELADETLKVETDYGEVGVKPASIRALAFSGEQPGRVVMQTWDTTVLRGRLAQEEFTFALAKGPRLRIHVGQVESIVRSQALPPEDVRKRVEQLVAQLGAESYQDRQKASEALSSMGPGIIPLLKRHRQSDDPEVRQRIEEILESLGHKAGAASTDSLPGFLQIEGVQLKGLIRN